MEKKIYVIDDDEVNNFVCERVIAQTKMAREVKSFMNPRKALQTLEEECSANDFPDVIFLDLNMPEIDGWRFMNAYDQLDATCIDQCSVFILTSSVSDEDRERAEELQNIKGFIPKPLTEASVADLMASS